MKNIKPFVTLLTVILLSIAGRTKLQAQEIEKVFFDKNYPVQSGAHLSITQEFGNLNCKNWDKNEISVKLTATVETRDQAKAEKEFNRVQWQVSGNDNEVIASCKLTSQKNGNNRNRTNIHLKLEVFMPVSVSLDVKQKFGEAFVDEVDGQANVNSEYGSLNINTLKSPGNKIKIAYGEGHINHFEGGDIRISYSSFSLFSSDSFSLESKFSDIDIQKSNKIRMALEGGTLNLGSATSLSGTSKYSTLNINTIQETLELTTAYGSASVSSVASGFSDILIDNQFGSVNLTIAKDAGYQIDANMVYCTLNYPESLAHFKYREKTSGKSLYRGVIGNEESPESKVTIQSKYGSVNLKAR